MQIQPAWLGAVVLSLSAHLALIASQGQGTRSGAPTTHIWPTVAPLQLRVLPPAPDVVPRLASAALENRPGEDVVLPVKPQPEADTRAVNPSANAADEAAAPSTIRPPPPPLPSATEVSTPAGLLALAETHYFWPGELGDKPQLLPETAPNQILTVPDVFPLPVIAHLLINEQGGVDKVLLEESFLSEAAKRFIAESFANTRFSPGMIDAKPVKSRLMIEVRLEGALPVLQ